MQLLNHSHGLLVNFCLFLPPQKTHNSDMALLTIYNILNGSWKMDFLALLSRVLTL